MDDGEYVNGQKHGEWTTYYANGQKRSEGRYDMGTKEGPWIQYWPNGNKKSVMTFEHGKYVGGYFGYHENGNRSSVGYYTHGTGTSADGTKEGPFYFYAEDGETVGGIITYHRGSRAKKDEHPNEKLEHPGPPATDVAEIKSKK